LRALDEVPGVEEPAELLVELAERRVVVEVVVGPGQAEEGIAMDVPGDAGPTASTVPDMPRN